MVLCPMGHGLYEKFAGYGTADEDTTNIADVYIYSGCCTHIIKNILGNYKF